MSTNYNLENEVRRVAIVCREKDGKGHALLTDSKKGENGAGSFTYMQGDSNQVACIQVWIGYLRRMNNALGNKVLTKQLHMLIPDNLYFLVYEDTRSYWLTHGTKKNGVAIDPQVLALVRELHPLMLAQKKNIKFFSHDKTTSVYNKSFLSASWRKMNEFVPRQAVEYSSAMGY